ncbi:MAG: hypothetical protein SPH18_08730 [Sutterella parvirubra]|nr:hypothetical protein [Sutterella parvirubra]
MSSTGVQIQKRKKGRYVSIIECFTDPVTGKRTSRTIKPFGYVEKDLEEDPDFMAKVYAECDQLRVDRAEAKRLRERQDMRLRPEREAYGSARLCIYGDAVLRRVWTELGLPGFFRASCCRSALGFDLDLHAFCAAASMILPPGDAVDSGVIVPQFLLDYGEVRAEHGPAMLTCLAGLRGRLEAFLAERVPDLAAFDPDDQEEAGPRETMCILPGLRAVRLETGTERRGFAVVRLLAEAVGHRIRKRLREEGEDIPFDDFVRLLTVPTLSHLPSVGRGEPLYLKTSHGFVPELRSIDPARTDVGREADRLMAAFGVGPMRTLETASGIRERLGVDLRLRIAAHG